MQIERLCRCEGHLFHARAPDPYLRFRPICRELVQSFLRYLLLSDRLVRRAISLTDVFWR
jgi:hypothetical protein